LVSFPNCKINLGLRILRKRNDGYHDLETIFYPLSFFDALELIRSPQQSFSTSGIPVDASPTDNLCVKAYELIRKDFPSLPPVKIHLHKTIPSGAGLGGGSADAAFMLRLLNRAFDLQLDDAALIQYALMLGSDCPFFIINKPCFATGRGEQLIPLSVDLSSYQIVLVNPRIHVETAKAFSDIKPAVPQKSVQQIISQAVETWKTELLNDFEAGIFVQYPPISDIKNELYQRGAVYASMSGSGSTVYGIFPKEMTIELQFPKEYFIKRLIGQFQ
jgi:4-diphosphocytidyl-2-C-methyl-D-erythritol kinase